MNKRAIEIIKQYIIETTDASSPGITDRAREHLFDLMREDRDIAINLWDRIEGLDYVDNVYKFFCLGVDFDHDQDEE